MKLEYTFSNFITSIETRGDLMLQVIGADGEYTYQVVNRRTGKVSGISKSYKRAQDAERYGRKALELAARGESETSDG